MLERLKRAFPIGGGAAIVEHGLPGPRKPRRGLGGLLGDAARGGTVIAALRFDIQTAQTQELGVLVPRHLVEDALGAGAVAGHLRRLRGEQQHQRSAR